MIKAQTFFIPLLHSLVLLYRFSFYLKTSASKSSNNVRHGLFFSINEKWHLLKNNICKRSTLKVITSNFTRTENIVAIKIAAHSNDSKGTRTHDSIWYNHNNNHVIIPTMDLQNLIPHGNGWSCEQAVIVQIYIFKAIAQGSRAPTNWTRNLFHSPCSL